MASASTLPFITQASYSRWIAAQSQMLHAAQRVEGPPPRAFPNLGHAFYDLSPLSYEFPPVTLTTLSHAVVRGRSNILTPREAIVRHDLVQLQTDVVPEEFYRTLAPSEDHVSAAWAPNDPFNVGYLPEAAAFTDWTAFNYAHWMTEVLPRIAALARSGRAPSVPLLVDSDLHPNIMRSIQMVSGPDVVVHRLAADELVRVGVLHNVSPTGYVPFKLRGPSAEGFNHGVFSPRALRETVEQLRRGIAGPGREAGRPKLFVRRNSALRRLVNEGEIETLLAGLGFVAIEPERLSLEEQIATFSNAGMVVGATGAAIANIIFCQPDCPTVVIMPKFRETAYWYWRRMAAAAGAGPVLHVSGDQVALMDDPYHPLALHQDFRVDVKDVLDAVEAAEALRR